MIGNLQVILNHIVTAKISLIFPFDSVIKTVLLDERSHREQTVYMYRFLPVKFCVISVRWGEGGRNNYPALL